MYRKEALFTCALLSGLALSLALLFVLARPFPSQAATTTIAAQNQRQGNPAFVLDGPLTDVAITGPTLGMTQVGHIFTAVVSPATTTVPITYTWFAASQLPVTHTGGLSDTVAFTWTTTGPQAITVTAVNAVNAVTGSHVITIYAPPQAAFYAAPLTGQRPLTVVFTDTSSGEITAWLWDFGDDITGTQQNPTHTYTTVGVYTVSLTVSGSGITDTLTHPHYITVSEVIYDVYLPLVLRNYPLQANFVATPTTGVAPLTVTFTNLSTSGYTFSLWDFGDGVTSTQASPTYTYTTIGAYTVTLTVSSGSALLLGCSDTLVRPNYITVVTTTPPYEPSDPTPDPDDVACQSPDVDLSWSGSDPDGDAVTYDVYLEADDATPDVLVSDDQSATTYDPGALASGAHYYWQIVAVDEYGAKTEGPVWNFTTCNTPAAPSDLQATPISWHQIRLNWQDNSSNETGFTIYDGVTMTNVAANAISYTFGGLAAGSYHCYRIRAFNDHGSSVWSDDGYACAMTLPCGEGIVNGGFENDSAWEFPVTPYPATYTVAITHTGGRAARTGIVDSADNIESWSSVQQTLAIPADVVSATLRFWVYRISGESPYTPTVAARPPLGIRQDALTQTPEDMQYVIVLNEADQPIRYLLWQRANEQRWILYEYDMMVHAGKTIKLRFGSVNDGWDGVTAMYVDDVSLEFCGADTRARLKRR
jgi:PKD repeat protein